MEPLGLLAVVACCMMLEQSQLATVHVSHERDRPVTLNRHTTDVRASHSPVQAASTAHWTNSYDNEQHNDTGALALHSVTATS